MLTSRYYAELDLSRINLAMPVQRKAGHFEVLLGLLKVFAHASDGGLADGPFWRQRLSAAIAKAEAILADQPDPATDGGAS